MLSALLNGLFSQSLRRAQAAVESLPKRWITKSYHSASDRATSPHPFWKENNQTIQSRHGTDNANANQSHDADSSVFSFKKTRD